MVQIHPNKMWSLVSIDSFYGFTIGLVRSLTPTTIPISWKLVQVILQLQIKNQKFL